MLTPEDGALVHRVLEDPGSDPTWFYHADKDYVALVQGLLTSHSGEPDTWHFADGSLIWKPELDHAEVCKGAAQGWHGFFCFGIKRFWGTKDLPGLMMSPDRVGQCQGVLSGGCKPRAQSGSNPMSHRSSRGGKSRAA